MFRRKTPVNNEYKNNKQKIEILITERTDITQFLEMDWIKKFILTIGRIRLDESSQSENEEVFRNFPDLFENNRTIKDIENKTRTSKVGAISKAQKAQNIFFEKNLKFSKKT